MQLLKIAFSLATLVLLACQQSGSSPPEQSDPSTVDSEKLVDLPLYRINSNRTSDTVATTIETRMQELSVPGLSLTVFDQDDILWSRAYGYADRSAGIKVTKNTLFQAASISKPVSSVAAFRLAEAGKLSLDEDVNEQLKSWRVPENEFTTQAKVTARALMSHTAGLSVAGFPGYARGRDIPTTVQVLDGSGPANTDPVRVVRQPNTLSSYSGGGMTVLQLLMEDVSETDFATLLQKTVLDPIGMDHSTFADPLPEQLKPAVANGYDENGALIPGGYHRYPEKAAAGLWTTPEDLARFMISLSRSYRGESSGILSKESARAMISRVAVPDAGGTGVGIDGEGSAFRFRHAGGNAGFKCYAVSFTDTGRGVVIMTNGDVGFGLIHEIARSLSKFYDWPPMFIHE